MKISSLLNEAEKTNSSTSMALPIDKDLIYRARNKYPGYSAEQAMILLIADEMKNQEKTDSTQNTLIDTQKRENERLRGSVQSLSQELQDFEQQSLETDREVERLKQLSNRISQGGEEIQRKAKVSADDLQKLEKNLADLKAKPGIDSEKVSKLEDQIKQIANTPSVDNTELNRIQQVIDSLGSKQVISDELYQKAFTQLQQTQEKLDAKEERFKKYISTKGKEVKTSSEEMKKYSDIVKGYKSEIDNFGKEIQKLDREKDIIIQLRAGVQQDAQTISDMKDEISAKLDLINNVTLKMTGQAQNDPSIANPQSGSGPNADILDKLAKGPAVEKNITKGAEQMLGRKLAEGQDDKPIKPLQKYNNPKYNEWLTNHLPALVQIFKNIYWKELERPNSQYPDEQIHYIIEKYTPMLYNLGDDKTPLTKEQVENWLIVVKNKLWEQPVNNQLDLFVESLDKTYERMLDKIIGLPYI